MSTSGVTTVKVLAIETISEINMFDPFVIRDLT